MIIDKHKPEEVLLEKFFNPKTIILFVILWVVIFTTTIISYNHEKLQNIIHIKEQCDALGISLEECQKIWEANPPLIDPSIFGEP